MKIDKYSLDDNWEEFQQESEQSYKDYADAVDERDTFENEVLNPYLAELDLEIRHDPSRFDLDRATDKAVEAIVRADQKAIKLRSEYIKLDRKVRAAKGKSFAINRDRDALVNLTKLYLSDYFYIEPRIGMREREQLQESVREDEIDEDLNTPEAIKAMKKKTNPKLKMRRKK